MTASPPKLAKPTTNPFKSAQILVVGEGQSTLVGSKGNVQTTQGPDLTTLPGKPGGPVVVIDLAARSELTYAAMAEYTPAEVLGGLQLDASAYTKRDNAEIYLGAFPTISDRDETAAMIGFINRANYATLSQDVQRTGLRMTTLIPGLAVATPSLLTDGRGTLLVEMHSGSYTVLLLEDGNILGRIKEFYRTEQLAQDVFDTLGTLVQSKAVQQVDRVALMGEPTLVEETAAILHEKVPDIEITTFSPAGLAHLLHRSAPLFALRGRSQAEATKAPWWPLVAGVALGLLPYGILSALNAGTNRQIQHTQDQIAAIQPQLAEGRALESEIARVQDVKAKAAAITDSRVDWQRALADLVGQLPQNGGQPTALFTRLSTDLPAPVAVATPAPTPAADGTTTTPAAAPIPAPSIPLPTYQLEFRAASRAAANSLITNLEQTYVLDTQTLTRNPDGSWRIQATAVTKPESTPPVAPTATPETP